MGCCEVFLVACGGWLCCEGVRDAGACAKITTDIAAVSSPLRYAAGLFIRVILSVGRQSVVFAGYVRRLGSLQEARRAVDALRPFLKVRILGAVVVHVSLRVAVHKRKPATLH